MILLRLCCHRSDKEPANSSRLIIHLCTLKKTSTVQEKEEEEDNNKTAPRPEEGREEKRRKGSGATNDQERERVIYCFISVLSEYVTRSSLSVVVVDV